MHAETQIREGPPLPCEERHYSVRQIAELWELSDDAVRKIFDREPGVIAIGVSRSNGRKRRYVTLRVPKAVLERVHGRLQGRAG
jgi:hypothetical protein